MPSARNRVAIARTYGSASSSEDRKRYINALLITVSGEHVAYVCPRETFIGPAESIKDPIGNWIADGVTENIADARFAIFPKGNRGP